VARPISGSTDHRVWPGWSRDDLKRVGVAVLVLAVVQAVLFYDHFAVALTFLFGLGLGLWLRSWTAAVPALISFLIAFALAAGTGWLHDAQHLPVLRRGLRHADPHVKDGEIVNIEGDPRSPHSEGTLCPKGAAIFQLHKNPNRPTQVLHRRRARPTGRCGTWIGPWTGSPS
jgi:hypothetical protein